MPVDWKSADSYNRLLAAVVAAMDGQMKLNYKRIADYYGEGATYDAIEGRFRIIKKQAAKLREEVERGERPVAPARGNGPSSNQSTPRKPRAPKTDKPSPRVVDGRVTKPSSDSSPTKKRPTKIKTEVFENSASTSTTSSYTDVDTPASSIDNGVIDNSFHYDPTLASFDMGGGLDGTDEHMGMMLMQNNYWDAEHIV